MSGTVPPVTCYPGTVVRAEIDSAALVHNIRTIAARIAPAALMCVLKADAYGHGIATAVRACRAAGITDLGVATVPEALQLTDLLGTDPAVRRERVLCWLFDSDTDLRESVRRGIEIGLTNPPALGQLAAAAQAAGRAARIHVKVDTGLGRNGLTARQLRAVIPELERTAAAAPGGIEIVGIMTHLATADVPSDAATAEQLAKFDAAVRMVRDLLGRRPALGNPDALIVHAANSPAALSLDPVPGSMARVGLSLYGLSPFEGTAASELGLRPVMTVRSRVLTVKAVPAGHGASYGLQYRAERDTRFALVAGGYADGIPRAASGRAEVTVRGRRLPVVGRIAMDQMILDIGDAQVEIGDEAVILGDGITGPSAEEWGAWANSINYEVVTRIGPRVARVPVGAPAAAGQTAGPSAPEPPTAAEPTAGDPNAS
ncbi:alanine racemase [Brevibacterium daeguense]|uniref:Alanine racemase n=1 Tax=Brevibacterium daeguense TaxID=909936 RepID=A0ABP8EFV9_9MICO